MCFESFTIRALVLALALSLSVPVSAQHASFTPEQQEVLYKIIREYLIANPEVLQEAYTELERRQQAAEQVRQTQVVTSERNKLENSPRDLVIGNPEGDTTVVEFLDYNCGYCKRAMVDVKALIKADPKLRVVIKDFPVLGPDSVEASRVALAAKVQLTGERVFEFHTRLIEARGRATAKSAKALAKEMSLDMGRLEEDLKANYVAATLQENMELGQKLGINGTPGFVIGNEIVAGAIGEKALREIIARVRK